MSEQFDGIMKGLVEILEYSKGNKGKTRSRIREIPPQIKPIKKYSKIDIKNIRIKLNLSQKTFAEILGVSQKTVEAWESGVNTPSGSSSRIIELIEKDESILENYVIVKS